jgi:hypothetical protein
MPTLRGPNAGEALGLGFDHRTEAIVAQRPVLLDVYGALAAGLFSYDENVFRNV